MKNHSIEDLQMLKDVYIRLYSDVHSAYYKSSSILSLYDKAEREIFIIEHDLREDFEGSYVLGHLR